MPKAIGPPSSPADTLSTSAIARPGSAVPGRPPPKGARAASANSWTARSATRGAGRPRRPARLTEADRLPGGLENRHPEVLTNVDLLAESRCQADGHVDEASVPLADDHV